MRENSIQQPITDSSSELKSRDTPKIRDTSKSRDTGNSIARSELIYSLRPRRGVGPMGTLHAGSLAGDSE